MFEESSDSTILNDRCENVNPSEQKISIDLGDEFLRLAMKCDHWQFVPVHDKAPIIKDWAKKEIKNSSISVAIAEQRATGVGLKLGECSNGMLAVDHDGSSIDRAIEKMSGMTIDQALPPTMTVTSGKIGRYTKFYLVPSHLWALIPNRKTIAKGAKIFNALKEKNELEELDIRFRDHQCVLIGSHPETGSYSWVQDPFRDDAIAQCPQWIIDQILIKEPISDSNYSDRQKRDQSFDHNFDEEIVKAKKALDVIPVSDLSWYEWRDVLMCLKAIGFEIDDILAWSKKSDKHDDQGFNDVVNHIKNDKGDRNIKIGTLIRIAKNYGYVPPKADRKAIVGELKKYIKVIFDESKDHGYFFYDFKNNVWEYTLNSTSVITQTMIPYYKLVGDTIDYLPKKYSNGKPVKDSNGDAEYERVEIDNAALSKKAVIDLSEIVHETNNTLKKQPNRNNNYIGFANGDFNLLTKELEGFDPDNMLFSRFERDYEKKGIETFQLFRDVFAKWFDDVTQADTYAYYLASILMNKGCDISSIVFFIGCAGSGKSTMADIANKIYRFSNNNSCLQLEGNALDHKFGLQGLSNATQLILVQELETLWGDLVEKRIKSGWGNETGRLTKEGKGIKLQTITRNFGLICDRQDYPKQNPNDEGFLRRIVYLKSPWTKNGESHEDGCIPTDFYNEEFKPTVMNSDRCWDFFLSALGSFTPSEALDKFNELKGDSIYKDARKFISESNDIYLDFVEDSVEFIEGSEKEIKESFVTKEETMQAIARYFTRMSQPIPKTSIPATMKNFRDTLEKIHPGSKAVQPPNNRKSIKGVNHTVIIGIKFKNSIDYQNDF